MKQAALPNGRLLEFPEDTSDKDIQRAVRRELGASDKNIIEALETLGEKLIERLTPLAHPKDTVTPALVAVNNTLRDLTAKQEIHTAKILNGLHATVKATETSDKQALSSFVKALHPMIATMEDMQRVFRDFRGEVKEAINYSHDITDANLKAAMKTVSGFNKTVEEISTMAKKIEAVLLELRASRQVSKRAVKNSDGSWTMEVNGRQN